MKTIKLFEEFVYGDLKHDQWVDSPEMNKIQPLKYRITPRQVDELKPGEVFVFGSNLQGIHTDGAAKFAVDKGWADKNQIEGISRSKKSYAIPTQSYMGQLSLQEIKQNIDEFFAFVKENPDMKFLVTSLGTNHAGYKKEQIAPLFAEAENLPNVCLPGHWITLI